VNNSQDLQLWPNWDNNVITIVVITITKIIIDVITMTREHIGLYQHRTADFWAKFE